MLGPLPALLVDLVPIAIAGLFRGQRIVRPGNLANLAAYGWEAVAASTLLAAVGVDRRSASTRCRSCCSPASSCTS